MAKKNESDVFFMSFVGEHVQIITNISFAGQQLDSEDSGPSSGPLPLIVEGIILDVDDRYIYLGTDEDEVSRAIRVSSVVMVQIKEDEEELIAGFSSLKKKDMN